MKSSITHKEITMIIGVVVAFLLIFTMWMRTPDSKLSHIEPATEFHFTIPAIQISNVSDVVKNVIEVLL